MRELRKEKIKQYIQQKKIVTINDLRALCPEVSLITIHRDLDHMAKNGEIIKIRGGAKIADDIMEPRFTEREYENQDAKMQIARKMCQELVPNSSIFMDAGTTIYMMAKIFPDIPMNVFTVAPNIAMELLHTTSKPTITMCSGNLNREHLMLTGYFTLEMLKSINIDMAIIGTSGFSLDCGFTCGVENQMMVKKLIMQRSRSVYILMDHSKLEHTFPFTFGTLEDVDYIVTDAPLPAPISEALTANNVVLL